VIPLRDRPKTRPVHDHKGYRPNPMPQHVNLRDHFEVIPLRAPAAIGPALNHGASAGSDA
jgi:hypothetical protein